MQIDGHFALTYVLSRLVGFEHKEAHIIAYSAQYVDDATNSGIIKFDNDAMFSRISSAHTMTAYDLKHYVSAHENHLVWVPFHFLPGNDGKMSDENVESSFINKLVCKPYSHVASDMLLACLKDIDKPYFYHRLGITMHVFADTFAHQDFAGVLHPINKVEDLKYENFDMSFLDMVKSKTLSDNFPMGHGAALTSPDMPFLEWSYINGLGERKERDNLKLFTDAAIDLFGQLGNAFYQKNGVASNDPLGADFKQIKHNFENFRSANGEERLKLWLESIARGDFSFGPQKLEYIPKGVGSWKHDAIEQDAFEDNEDEVFRYSKEFMQSNWRNFHVALKKHRFDVVNDILPNYGICVS